MVTSSFKDKDSRVKHCKILAKRNLYIHQFHNDLKMKIVLFGLCSQIKFENTLEKKKKISTGV